MSNLLQSPIIYWAGLAVRVLHVYLSNLGIVAHHIQRAMPEQRLDDIDRYRVAVDSAQQTGGKSMAQHVRTAQIVADSS